MKSFLASVLTVTVMSVAMTGCGTKSEVKKTTTVSTPGGTTTSETKQEVKKSGENPPPAQP